MKKEIKRLAGDAIIGIIAGKIADWIISLIDKRKQIHGKLMCSQEHLYKVKSIHFDFDKCIAIDLDTGEVLIDYRDEKNPEKEMVKTLKYFYN